MRIEVRSEYSRVPRGSWRSYVLPEGAVPLSERHLLTETSGEECYELTYFVAEHQP